MIPLIIDVSDATLCYEARCEQVVVNPTKTRPGLYDVEAIWLNASMKTPSNHILPPSAFGGIMIDLKGTDIAIHSWLDLNFEEVSSGCVRTSLPFINDLVYLPFGQVIIQP